MPKAKKSNEVKASKAKDSQKSKSAKAPKAKAAALPVKPSRPADKLAKPIGVANEKKAKAAPAVVEKATSPRALAKKSGIVDRTKGTGKSKATKPKTAAAEISTDDIALRAYYIAERRNAMGWPGDSESDWVEAETQLRAERNAG